MPGTAPDPGAGDPLGLGGVVPPTVTAFDETGAVDETATAAHARFVVENGADAVFPLGTNGEFALLEAERLRSDVVAHRISEGRDERLIASEPVRNGDTIRFEYRE